MGGRVSLSTTRAAALLGSGARGRKAAVQPAPAVDAPQAADRPDLRLLVEETDEPGVYIYTLVDRRTGQIVSQMNRDELLRMREQAGYAAGSVIDSQA